ncbi:GTPase ObgE [uncultured Desulfuromusa sp.]|uniref:GTPase ObgE n=1 Tax=uncultured Desulfuromusa sp. TaxID=219183 RepID=UPI002AA6887D|nr:GTPase ObgE [uncultured Desulfuromusa sp.]
MKFVDQVRIEVKAGDGGRGCVSFLREKFVPRGGPDGGDGGDGGSVYFVVDSALSTLLDYRYLHHCKAKNGAPGLGKTKHGKNGEDLELRVPQGTLIYDDDTDELLADLTEIGKQLLFLPGGKGGRGNARFATSTNRAPRHAQPGIAGEVKSLRLELKLLADVGLVGLPNAGKSTLISALSAAKPKIADYPFTTLVPNLGVVPYGGFKTMVIADIPGLIAGASDGQGLGTRFLRHVERTDLFLHLVDTSCMQEGDPVDNFEMINAELKRYDESLTGKPQLVVLTKIDVPEVREKTLELTKYFESLNYMVFAVSAVTGEGLKELVTAVGDELDRLRAV